MFTGIIEETGTVLSVVREQNSAVLVISCSKVLEDAKAGDSIAVNGICLTVKDIAGKNFTTDVMPETIRMSCLKEAKAGTKVNLERAMQAGSRFGGHIVSGHIDGTGVVCGIRTEGNAVWYTINADAELLKYIVAKGSITIDGISLTAAQVTDNSFQVSVIPHTRAITNLAGKEKGSTVNLEVDIIGKYVERFLAAESKGSVKNEITEEYLQEHGF